MIDTANITLVPARVIFLEMHTPPETVLPAIKDEVSFAAFQKPVDLLRYRKLYDGVGRKYHWLDRMVMADELLSAAINHENVFIFVVSIAGQEAGFVEFVLEEESVEILYFGLLDNFVGKGYGRFFLQWAITKAWSYGRSLVKLNTCELDHPNALPNYINAGFTIVKTEMQKRKFSPALSISS